MTPKSKAVQKFYEHFAYYYFLAATVLLMLIAVYLLADAVLDMVRNIGSEDLPDVALNSIGLIIIGFAVVETAKFIAEEEIIRERELRSSMESRRSITKFTTIIVIAISLEALVMVFKSNDDNFSTAIYPAALFGASMFALIALGIYQYLSSRIEPPTPEEKREASEAS